MKNCKYCGSPINDFDVYCSNCGKIVERANSKLFFAKTLKQDIKIVPRKEMEVRPAINKEMKDILRKEIEISSKPETTEPVSLNNIKKTHQPKQIERSITFTNDEGFVRGTVIDETGNGLSYMGIRDISQIWRLDSHTDLRYLNLDHNKLREIKLLDGLINLTRLKLDKNQISEIKNLSTLKKLKVLSLEYNKIMEIKGLNSLTQLKTLNLSHNKITEIKGLDAFTQLKTLNLDYNNITKIKGLENLQNLESLSLSGNKISTIEGLVSLPKLRSLFLSNNQIDEIKNLKSLSSLEVLYLSNNRLTDINGLNAFKTLKKVRIDGNRIKVLNYSDFPPNAVVRFKNNFIREYSKEFEKCSFCSEVFYKQELESVTNHDLLARFIDKTKPYFICRECLEWEEEKEEWE